MANTLEQPLLLPDDMADLRTMKKHEVFLTLKRDLALVSFSFSLLLFFIFYFFTKAIQATHMVEELMNNSHKQMKEEEGRCITAVEAFTLAKQKVKDLNAKLTEAIREKKSAEAALEGVERQAKTQRQWLGQTKDQLSISKK